MFIPILPTTPFLLLSAALYARSSERFYNWLINNRVFGRYINSYREGKAIPLRIKIIAITLLWVTIGCSAIFAADILWVKIMLVIIAAGSYNIRIAPGTLDGLDCFDLDVYAEEDEAREAHINTGIVILGYEEIILTTSFFVNFFYIIET